MRRFVPSFFAVAMVLPWHAPALATTWLCGLSEDLVRLVCVADPDPAEVVADSGSGKATAVVNGTRFPLDARTVYTVDLWSPPTEVESVALLARATICYRSPGCQVVMAPLVQTRGGVAPAQWTQGQRQGRAAK